MGIEEKIESKRKTLHRIRERSEKAEADFQITVAQLKLKCDRTAESVKNVLDAGQDHSTYVSSMKRAMEDENPTSSIVFGHQVLLLLTVHQMEVQETLLRLVCKQNRKLVKLVDRFKEALREQNNHFEMHIMNKLRDQFEGMKKLEEEYRSILQFQQMLISRFEWKSAIPSIPSPTLITTSQFMSHQEEMFHPASSKAQDLRSTKTPQEFANSMRNLMELDSTFPPPSTDDLIPTIHAESLNAALEDPGVEAHSLDFFMSLNKDSRSSDSRNPKGRRRVKRSTSFDSTDSLSTSGEELLQGIQSIFSRSRIKNSKDDQSVADSIFDSKFQDSEGGNKFDS
jgi:hypothetical protein